MALPPLGPGPLAQPLAEALRFMRSGNGDSRVTRVENVPEACVDEVCALGYRAIRERARTISTTRQLCPTCPASRLNLVRAACNRFIRERGGMLEPYEPRDERACVSLFHEWREQKQQAGSDDWACALLEDAAVARMRRHCLTLPNSG